MRIRRAINFAYVVLCILTLGVGIAFAPGLFYFIHEHAIPSTSTGTPSYHTVTPTTTPPSAIVTPSGPTVVTPTPTTVTRVDVGRNFTLVYPTHTTTSLTGVSNGPPTSTVPNSTTPLTGVPITLSEDPTFDFTLSNNGDVTVFQGVAGRNKITASWVSGSTQTVTLSCTGGLPSGATCSFTPSASGTPSFSANLTVTTSVSTPTGAFVITVTGTAGALSRTTSFSLTVNQALTLTLSSTPIYLTESVTLSGTAAPTPPAGTPVTLSYSLDSGTTWIAFLTTRTDSGGSYSADWTPPYFAQYGTPYWLKATWAGRTSETRTLIVTNPALPYHQAHVGLLVAGPTSTSRSSSVNFDIILSLSSPETDSATGTIWVEITGPSGYRYYTTIAVSVDTSNYRTYTITWQAPSTPGDYQIVAGVIPSGTGGPLVLGYPLYRILPLSMSKITVT